MRGRERERERINVFARNVYNLQIVCRVHIDCPCLINLILLSLKAYPSSAITSTESQCDDRDAFRDH